MWQRWERGKQTLVHVASIISQRFSLWVRASEPSMWAWKKMGKRERECVKAFQIMYEVCTCSMHDYEKAEELNWQSWKSVAACLSKKSNKRTRCCVGELKDRNMKNWEKGKTGGYTEIILSECYKWQCFSYPYSFHFDVLLVWLHVWQHQTGESLYFGSLLFTVTDPTSHPSLNQTLARVLPNVDSTHIWFTFYANPKSLKGSLRSFQAVDYCLQSAR